MRLRRLHELHPGQVADLVEEASPEEAAEIIEAVGEDRAFEADVFEELDQEHQLELVARRSDAEVAQLLARMAPDDAADLLTELDQRRREPILAALEPGVREELRRLLSYNPDSAGGLMSPNRVVLPAGATATEAIAELRARPEVPENLDTVFLVDDQGRLTGALPLAGLLRAPETARLEELAQPDPPRVRTDADLVEVTLVMTDYNLTSLPVVDDDDRLVGVVTIDDVVEQLVPENWRRRAESDEA
jgi:Mg/Co/Ni transporter MgtE